MKFVVLFAIIAAWVSSSEAVTCAGVSSCTPDLSMFQGSDGSQEDINKACTAINTAISCFREAMADCRENNPNIPESTINSLEQQMNTYDQMLKGKCDGAGPTPSAAGTLEKLSVFGVLAMSLLALFL